MLKACIFVLCKQSVSQMVSCLSMTL